MAQEIIPAGSFYPAYTGRAEAGGIAEITKQVCFVAFKWNRLIVGVFLVFTIAAAIAMWMKPPVRSATAEILIKLDRQTLQISGLAGRPDRTQILQIMNSEVQLIESRQVLEAVARKLLSRPGETIDEDQLEAKISSLASSVFPVPQPDSNVLKVTYLAQTSEEAARILRLIIDEYIEVQAAIQSGSNRLLKFYEHEKQRVEAQLRAAEDQLNEWQGKNQTVSINQQITNQLDILQDRQKALQQTDAHLEATKAKIAAVRNQLNAQPERLLMDQDQVNNPLGTKLKEQLVTAEVALQDLLQRFTEKHRSVIEKKEQIAFLKKELAGAGENIVGRETTGLNPLRQALKQQLSDAQALLSSLMSQKEIVGKQVGEASTNVAALREKKVKIDALSRLVELHKDSFMLYGKKLEEGRIATGLGKEQLANVALIGPPRATSGTDLNKQLMMIVLSAFVGLVLGMAIAFGIEFMNNALRTRQDVEYYLGLPVLATVPELPPRPLMLSR
jgi:uncharacterized protein involved in exopolysaccharide biosynthesis